MIVTLGGGGGGVGLALTVGGGGGGGSGPIRAMTAGGTVDVACEAATADAGTVAGGKGKLREAPRGAGGTSSVRGVGGATGGPAPSSACTALLTADAAMEGDVMTVPKSP